MNRKQYDVAIIGGGISGLMCAYRILEKKPSASVILIEKGADRRTKARRENSRS